MEDPEAAFLASMNAANEAAGNFEATDGASDQPAESNSDEYDPFQAMPPIQSSAQTSKSPPHQTFSSAPLSSSNHVSPPVPLTSDTVSQAHDTSAADGRDPQSQSRSMSRESSSEASDASEVKIETNPGASVSQDGQALQPPTNGFGSMDNQKESSVDTTEAPDTTVATPFHEADAGVVSDGNANTEASAIDVTALLKKIEPAAAIGMANDVAKSPTTVTGGDADKKPTGETSQVTAQIPKVRLPHDTIGILEDRIKEDQRGDIEAWLELIAEYRKRGKLDDARSVYERFFVVFPSAVCS